jgi:SAM-dependent methyltransferase
MEKQNTTITAAAYVNRKTPCTITPTFRYIKPFVNGRTLDVGMGTGEYLEMFPPGSAGVDISEENIRAAKEKGLEVYAADINQPLPFADSFFETIFCSHVIEHVDSPLNLLRESRRLLVPQGYLILAVPLEKTVVRLVRDGFFKDHKGHLYGLSVECMERLLEQAEFEIVKKYYNFPLINRFCFIDKIMQAISCKYCQYFCTMYWIVAKKK